MRTASVKELDRKQARPGIIALERSTRLLSALLGNVLHISGQVRHEGALSRRTAGHHGNRSYGEVQGARSTSRREYECRIAVGGAFLSGLAAARNVEGGNGLRATFVCFTRSGVIPITCYCRMGKKRELRLP